MDHYVVTLQPTLRELSVNYSAEQNVEHILVI